MMRLVYGFMQDPIVPDALRVARIKGLDVGTDDITYFLGRETILVTHRRGMALWRKKLFVLMTRNAVRATAFFRLALSASLSNWGSRSKFEPFTGRQDLTCSSDSAWP